MAAPCHERRGADGLLRRRRGRCSRRGSVVDVTRGRVGRVLLIPKLEIYTPLADGWKNEAMATEKGVRRPCRWDAIIAFALALVVAGCGRHEGTATPAAGSVAATALSSSQTDLEKVLNIYNWADYIDPSVVPAFEKEYGLKVSYDVFDSNDVLETKLLAGRTGYDVVVPTAPFLQRQIQVGVYQKLDKALLPNLKNLDAKLSRSVEVNDPGNQYGVIYFSGTSRVGSNSEKIAQATR